MQFCVQLHFNWYVNHMYMYVHLEVLVALWVGFVTYATNLLSRD